MIMIYINNHPVNPKDVQNVSDLGYLGVEEDFPEQPSSIHNRKKMNLELSQQEEKEYNINHSKKRIVIEHVICKLKKYRILSYIFRNKSRKYDKVSNIVAGLINYKILNQ